MKNNIFLSIICQAPCEFKQYKGKFITSFGIEIYLLGNDDQIFKAVFYMEWPQSSDQAPCYFYSWQNLRREQGPFQIILEVARDNGIIC